MSRAWHKGPPPFVGWWNASVARQHNTWRWWDGGAWSIGVDSREEAEFARVFAFMKSGRTGDVIEWTDYYPENARVPRVWPDGRVQK